MQYLTTWRRRDGTILYEEKESVPDDKGPFIQKIKKDYYAMGVGMGSLTRVVTRYCQRHLGYRPSGVARSFSWRCRRCRRRHQSTTENRILVNDDTSFFTIPCYDLGQNDVLISALEGMPAGPPDGRARRRIVFVKRWRGRDGRIRRRTVVRRDRAGFRLLGRFKKVSIDLWKVFGPFYKGIARLFEDGRRRPSLVSKYIAWPCRDCGGDHAVEMEVFLRREDGGIVDLLCDGGGNG